jgi:hypothetical protein
VRLAGLVDLLHRQALLVHLSLVLVVEAVEVLLLVVAVEVVLEMQFIKGMGNQRLPTLALVEVAHRQRYQEIIQEATVVQALLYFATQIHSL